MKAFGFREMHVPRVKWKAMLSVKCNALRFVMEKLSRNALLKYVILNAVREQGNALRHYEP